MLHEYMPIVAIFVLVFIIWSNYQDIQLIKQYQQKRVSSKIPVQHSVYPWWYSGFPHGGFSAGPWTWNRQQHYYHPGVGWYASPFPLG